MIIFVAADHNGFELKAIIMEYLKKRGYNVEDAGDTTYNPDDDFPIFAQQAAHKVLQSSDNDPRAILTCGSGQGMVMAANRIRGIRAGLGWSRKAAQDLRKDENANVIAIPAILYQPNDPLIFDIIEDFLHSPFANAPRYVRRNKELDEIGA